MKHLVLFFACVLSIEAIIRFQFLSLIDSILQVTKKVVHILPNKNISDHWKELVISSYALKIMKFSIQILLVLLCILSFFFIADIFLSGFLVFTLSLIGIVESMLYALGYVYLRKLLKK